MIPIYVLNVNIITNAAMVSTSVVLSSSIEIKEVKNYSIQAVWSAGSTPVGSLQLQGSNDNSSFSNIGSSVSVSGNTGSAMLSDSNTGYAYARLQYTNTSGSGTLNASLSAKR